MNDYGKILNYQLPEDISTIKEDNVAVYSDGTHSASEAISARFKNIILENLIGYLTNDLNKQYGTLLNEQQREIEDKHKKIKELEAKIAKDKETNAKRDRKYVEISLELDNAKERLAQFESQEEQHKQTVFNYIYEKKDFSKDLSENKIVKLLDSILELAEAKDKKGNYLIKDRVDIAAIYLSLKGMNIFNGKPVDFSDVWMWNIMPRLSDSSRNKKLKLKGSQLSNSINGQKYKEYSVISWKNLVLSGQHKELEKPLEIYECVKKKINT